MKKLILGTANFGMAYGKSSRTNGLHQLDVEGILCTAIDNDIDVIDTAIGYGGAERILGTIGVSRFKIISKIPSLRKITNIKDYVVKSVEESCARLGIECLEALLLHDPDDLAHSTQEQIVCALNYVKDQGLIKKAGASLYSPKDFDWNATSWIPDILQVPLNILDCRFYTTNFLNEAVIRGVEVHTRSTFLKGLLLSEGTSSARYFIQWRDLLNLYEQYSEINGSKVQACVGHVNSFPESRGCVVGVSSSRQLEEIVSANLRNPQRAPDELQINDVKILDPRNWKI